MQNDLCGRFGVMVWGGWLFGRELATTVRGGICDPQQSGTKPPRFGQPTRPTRRVRFSVGEDISRRKRLVGLPAISGRQQHERIRNFGHYEVGNNFGLNARIHLEAQSLKQGIHRTVLLPF